MDDEETRLQTALTVHMSSIAQKAGAPFTVAVMQDSDETWRFYIVVVADTQLNKPVLLAADIDKAKAVLRRYAKTWKDSSIEERVRWIASLTTPTRQCEACKQEKPHGDFRGNAGPCHECELNAYYDDVDGDESDGDEDSDEDD